VLPRPPGILRWAFYSPARLAAVCIVVAGIVIGGVVLAGSQTVAPARGPTPQQRVPEPVGGVSTPPATPDAAAAPTERVPPSVRAGMVRSAREFVEAWALDARQPSRVRWLRGMRPLTTRTLYRGLRVTDPALLPRGHVRHVDLDEAGPFAGTAVVALTRNVRVEVRLVAERDRWLVADIRPAGP